MTGCRQRIGDGLDGMDRIVLGQSVVRRTVPKKCVLFGVGDDRHAQSAHLMTSIVSMPALRAGGDRCDRQTVFLMSGKKKPVFSKTSEDRFECQGRRRGAVPVRRIDCQRE